MQMSATKPKPGLFGVGMLLLGTFMVVDAVWAQGGGVIRPATRFFGGRGSFFRHSGRLQR
jgi:hypothetical protein